MFKKNICLLTILGLFVGCVQKNVTTVETHDLSNYWFNMKDLSNNKVVLNKNLTQQFNDGNETSRYTDYILYKKDQSNLSQIEQYTFFEDINKQNYKAMILDHGIDLKYNILENEIKETYVLENEVSNYKRNLKINDKVINQKEIDGSSLVCNFSKYYENVNIKNKINEFFNKKYFSEDRNYNNVIELQCKDSFVDGEYYIYMAKDVGTILFVRKDKDDGSLEESFSILESQTVIE